MRTVTSKQLAGLQKSAKHIRHICILAHVDHGKTTLADSVLASNGIISQKMAGQLRYMDSRKDEQERGITMKSSAVAVHYNLGGENYLINLIDSPGHADFSGEVCTAVRLCDGAIVMVDVVEGVCPQTKVALRQAWIEHLHPLLVLNKIDRLIMEWKLTPIDAYAHLVQVLEQVNAVMGELFAADILQKSENKTQMNSDTDKNTQIFDWSSGLEDSDDSTLYFSPGQGNVIFASALDGWGFSISHFAKMYSVKLGFKEEILQKTLWSDFYLNGKTKRIMKGAHAKAKKPLFVQLILENIWAVYDATMIKQDKVITEKIVQSLNLKITARDAKHSDPKIRLQAVFSQWLPLSSAVLEMVCTFVPSPLDLKEEKVEGLMCSSTHKFDHLPLQTRQLKKDFQACCSSDDAPVIVCVSKMFPVEKNMLPKNKQGPLTVEDIALRHEKARERHAKRLESNILSAEQSYKTQAEEKKDSIFVHTESSSTSSSEYVSDTAFVAFARVYSGTLRKGQQCYVLGPKHDPAQALKLMQPINDNLTLKDLNQDQHITIATIGQLYLLMGKELEELEDVPAGNVLGIGGLEDHVLKSATLSSTIACPRFIDLHSTTIPIMRVALEPSHPREMPALVQGMKLLNQADPCVQVFVQESGEHVLVTAGEIHLQRCIDDLKERFAKIDINVSAPIVSFRETIIPPPTVDMVNEAIEEKSHQKKSTKVHDKGDDDEYIRIKTANKLSSISMKATSLPPEVTKLLEQNSSLLKEQDRCVSLLCSGESELSLTTETLKSIEELKAELHRLFCEAGNEWSDVVDKIWAFGPRRCGPNILLNKIPNYKRPSVWLTSLNEKSTDSPLFNYDSSFISGFQLATLAGPLCEEPMMGVCFIVEEWKIENDIVHESDCTVEIREDVNRTSDDKDSSTEDCDISDTVSVCSSGLSSASSVPFGPFTGQIMSTVKEACRKAFQARPQRLMTAMYSCNIQVTTDMLGKMYAVLGRRHGRILHADMQEGSQTFHVIAELPVVESFDFANEIRKQTSGMALPQLVFSHWEAVDVDPFWVPHTDEEYAHFGEKADSDNRARTYVNGVRRRKGLSLDEKIVEHAEKQRTLKRNK